MQNARIQTPSFWARIGAWGQDAGRFNSPWLRRFTTFLMGVVVLTLAASALADTTDYDVNYPNKITITWGVGPSVTTLPGSVRGENYDYVVNSNGGPQDGVESGHMSSVKLSDGDDGNGDPETAYPATGGFNGVLPGDLFPGDVVDIDVDMAAIKQGNGSPDYSSGVTVKMWVLDEPTLQGPHGDSDTGSGSWVDFTWVDSFTDTTYDSDAVVYNSVGDCDFDSPNNDGGCDSMKVTITIPSPLYPGDKFGRVKLTDGGDDLLCNAGDAYGPLKEPGTFKDDSTPLVRDLSNGGWYDAGGPTDADGNPIGDYCYKVKVQARANEPKFGNGSGMVFYFNIDPPDACTDFPYDFAGFVSPNGNEYKVNSVGSTLPVKFRIRDGGGKLSAEDANELVDGDLDNGELSLWWVELDADGEPTATEGMAEFAVQRQGNDNNANRNQYHMNIDMAASGMEDGHDYRVYIVYTEDGVDPAWCAIDADASFLVHVAHWPH